MGKNNKTKESTNNEDDAVDYIFDNVSVISNSVTELSKHARDVWDVIPEVFYNIICTVYNIFNKIMMKTRSSLVVQLTEDIKHHDTDKDMWEYLLSMSRNKSGDKSELSKKMKIIKKKMKTKRGKDLCKLTSYYIKKRRKEEFLSFCITQQNNPEFIEIREFIVTDMSDNDDNSHDPKLEKLISGLNKEKFKRLE